MAYPTGVKIFIDGVDCTYYITGYSTFDPTEINNTFRDVNITPYLRRSVSVAKMVDRNYKGSDTDLHTIEIIATDGNGRAEVRVEVR